MYLSLQEISDESLQSQLVRQVSTMIINGELLADTQLPSIRKLASEQKVSVITVQRAYETLEREDFIYSRRGKGFFVAGFTEAKRKKIAINNLKEKLIAAVESARSEGLDDSDIENTLKNILENETKVKQ